jgi:putative transposase
MLFQRADRYRFYPTSDQANPLARTFGYVRWVYNWGLPRRSSAYFERQERIDYKPLATERVVLQTQEATAWLKAVSSVCLQQALQHRDQAFTRFFKKTAAYPTFKSRRGDQSCSFMANAFVFRDGNLTLAKQNDPLAIRWSRPLPAAATPSSVTVTRTSGGRYYVSILVDEEMVALPVSANETGIDLYTKEIVCSNGRYCTPAQLAVLEERKQRHQRACKRKIAAAKVSMGLAPNAKLAKGQRLPISANLRKAFLKVGRVTERAANLRRDGPHKTTTSIVRENQVIAMEDLNVKGMTASAVGTVADPGKNVTPKSGLNHVGFGEIRRQLEYKALWAGRTAIKIDRWYPSSKRCSCCGHILKQRSLSQRHWTCPHCATRHDRDENAAKNILAAGKAELAGADGLRIHE